MKEKSKTKVDWVTLDSLSHVVFEQQRESEWKVHVQEVGQWTPVADDTRRDISNMSLIQHLVCCWVSKLRVSIGHYKAGPSVQDAYFFGRSSQQLQKGVWEWRKLSSADWCFYRFDSFWRIWDNFKVGVLNAFFDQLPCHYQLESEWTLSSWYRYKRYLTVQMTAQNATDRAMMHSIWFRLLLKSPGTQPSIGTDVSIWTILVNCNHQNIVLCCFYLCWEETTFTALLEIILC